MSLTMSATTTGTGVLQDTLSGNGDGVGEGRSLLGQEERIVAALLNGRHGLAFSRKVNHTISKRFPPVVRGNHSLLYVPKLGEGLGQEFIGDRWVEVGHLH